MRNRLIVIFVCVLLANVVNYALGEWVEARVAIRSPGEVVVDGSSLTLSRYVRERPDTSLALTTGQEALFDFYTWLDEGGTDNYRLWRSALRDALLDRDDPELIERSGVGRDEVFISRALQIADATNTSRYLSLLLLVIVVLLLWGKALKESSRLTPFLYLGITAGTTTLYGSLSAPLYTAVVVGSYVIYLGAVRLSLPVFHTEWCRMMRPFLTLQLFVLAIMAFRGPELVNYWFWTSPLFRLSLTLVTLLTFFFHLAIVMRVLKKGNMDTAARCFGYGMPLGLTLIVLGLVLGFYGPEAGASLARINFELMALPPETVAAVNPESPFLLSGAGILLSVVGGIGYFVQRIAR